MYIHNGVTGEVEKPLQHIHARAVLLPDGWASNVRIIWTEDRITEIVRDATAGPTDEVHDVVLPAIANLHTHAFQRAMAGLAETRGATPDSFWSWRTLMYDFALKMSPDDVEAVAAQLYMEMLEQGFTRVGEFHYLHHDRDGRPYANIAEHATRVAAASAQTGIGLTLLPVFYAHAGFGALPPHDGQRRFINLLSQFEKLLAASADAIKNLPGANLGIAPHSLRAVTPEQLKTLVAMAGDSPIHMHIAEQTQEVEDCLAWCGARPVQWLLDHAPVAKNWCLIHATHMTEVETIALAQSGAVAGLCPITEANLGDGIFPAPSFMQADGSFGVGSDSNVQISLAGELRQLEYSQRLNNRARNVFAEPNASNGRCLYNKSVNGGAAALGVSAGLAAGCPADMLSLDCDALPYLKADQILDHWIFSEGFKVDCVWAMGEKQVERGQHRHRMLINSRFLQVMKRLLAG
jgi:formimidoylglutamate deiminase